MKRLAIGLVLAMIGAPALAAPPAWREAATPSDRDRLSRLSQAWSTALAQVGRSSQASELRRYGVLLSPGGRLPNPEPPPGSYRCRTIKVGSQFGGPVIIPYASFRCRVSLSPGGDLKLEKVTGSQRQVGFLYPDTTSRLVFLGSLALGTEQGAPAYGSDPERDQAGVFERIGSRRYRLALPFPKTESVLDVIELVPESGPHGASPSSSR